MIARRGAAYFIYDLGSRNGTFVNGERVGKEPVQLGVGDTIRIGHVECCLTTLEGTGRITTDNPPEMRDEADTEPIVPRPKAASDVR